MHKCISGQKWKWSKQRWAIFIAIYRQTSISAVLGHIVGVVLVCGILGGRILLWNIVVVKYYWHFVVKYCCGQLSEDNFVVKYRWGRAKGLKEIFLTFGTIFVTFGTIFVTFRTILLVIWCILWPVVGLLWSIWAFSGHIWHVLALWINFQGNLG